MPHSIHLPATFVAGRIQVLTRVKFIAIADEWFWAMEKGEANLRMPDPNGKRYDMDYCDRVIDAIDNRIASELVRYPDDWSEKGIDTPADFNRIEGASREAFIQELMAVFNGS